MSGCAPIIRSQINHRQLLPLNPPADWWRKVTLLTGRTRPKAVSTLLGIGRTKIRECPLSTQSRHSTAATARPDRQQTPASRSSARAAAHGGAARLEECRQYRGEHRKSPPDRRPPIPLCPLSRLGRRVRSGAGFARVAARPRRECHFAPVPPPSGSVPPPLGEATLELWPALPSLRFVC